jgi:hypothetical protein
MSNTGFWLNIIQIVLFAILGIYSTFKMKKAKDNKDLFKMLDEMCTSILAYLAMMLTILMR